MSFISKISSVYRTAGQKIGAALASPSKAQLMMVAAGLAIVASAAEPTLAQDFDTEVNYNDETIGEMVSTLFAFLHGSFGALIMVVAGIGAIMASAFGQYKAALGCLVVAVGSFVLKAFVQTFFNTESIEGLN